ncbi:MAG: hypothetical protein IJE66_03395 [Akkermansia sp.]|nr:hypothetical protein [Akkermansia sp.]
MKASITTVCMVALMGCPLVAQEATVTAAPAAEPGMSVVSRSYLEISRSILQTLRELTSTLDAVQDKSDADASAQQVLAIADKMQKLQAEAETIPMLTPEQEAEVKANINEQEVKETVHNFLVSVVQMAQVNCYESEALNNALSLMLGKHITTVEN